MRSTPRVELLSDHTSHLASCHVTARRLVDHSSKGESYENAESNRHLDHGLGVRRKRGDVRIFVSLAIITAEPDK